MKLLGILIAVLIVAISQQSEPVPKEYYEYWAKIMAPYKEECLRESGANPELSDRVVLYKEFPENNRPLMCFIKCMAQKLNYFSEEGDLNITLLNSLGLPMDLLNKCKILKGRDLCETAYRITGCNYIGGADLIKISENP